MPKLCFDRLRRCRHQALPLSLDLGFTRFLLNSLYWTRVTGHHSPQSVLPYPHIRNQNYPTPLRALYNRMNLQDAVDHRRVAVPSHLPAVELIRAFLNLNRPEAILDVELLIRQPPLGLPSRNHEVVGQDAVECRAISSRHSVEPFVGQFSN